MIKDALLYQLTLNVRAIKANCHGVDHPQSLIAPSPAGNGINWVVGHVIAVRSRALHKILGLPPIFDEATAAPYERGSTPLAAADAQPLESLLALLSASQKTLPDAVAAMSDASLAAAAPQPSMPGVTTVGSLLAGLAFHEAYHVGQTGILRRLLGLEGAIA